MDISITISFDNISAALEGENCEESKRGGEKRKIETKDAGRKKLEPGKFTFFSEKCSLSSLITFFFFNWKGE